MDNRDDLSRQWSELLEKIRDVKFAMLTTENDEGRLHSRPMAILEAEETGVLWFFTARSSRKSHEVEEHRRVNLAFVDGGHDTFLSVAGEARLVDDPGKARELWNPMMKSWFPQGLEDPELTLLRVDVEEAEYWDMASKKVVSLFHLAKALVGRGDRGEGFRGHGTVRPQPGQDA
jgi:general stress protein 26